MKQNFSSKIISLIFGSLVVIFAVGFYVFAVWTEPTKPPPEDNVLWPPPADPIVYQIGNVLAYKSAEQYCFDHDNDGTIECFDQYFSQTMSHTCPPGTVIVNVHCKEVIVDGWPGHGGGSGGPANVCECSVIDNTVTVESKIMRNQGTNHPGGYTQFSSPVRHCIAGIFTPTENIWSVVDCVVPHTPCAVQFQCGVIQQVGE